MEVVSVAAISRSLTSLTTLCVQLMVVQRTTGFKSCWWSLWWRPHQNSRVCGRMNSKWEPLRGRILLSSCLPPPLPQHQTQEIQAPSPSPEMYLLLLSTFALMLEHWWKLWLSYHTQSVVHSSFKAEIQTKWKRNCNYLWWQNVRIDQKNTRR